MGRKPKMWLMRFYLRFFMKVARSLSLLAMFLLGFRCNASDPSWYQDYDEILSRYGRSAGFHYNALLKNESDLHRLANLIEEISHTALDLKDWDQNEVQAFYINAFNVHMLNQVLKHYPIRDIHEISLSFYYDFRIRVADDRLSFDQLERKILEDSHDPRIHFAVTRCSQSSPPLFMKAFRASTLDHDLEKITRSFLNSSEGLQLVEGGKVIKVSRIFQWYDEDFEKNGKLLDVIRKYSGKSFPDDVSLEFLDFKWMLNDLTDKESK
jgi:hypothetical protein